MSLEHAKVVDPRERSLALWNAKHCMPCKVDSLTVRRTLWQEPTGREPLLVPHDLAKAHITELWGKILQTEVSAISG